jgi:hypothetical protein
VRAVRPVLSATCEPFGKYIVWPLLLVKHYYAHSVSDSANRLTGNLRDHSDRPHGRFDRLHPVRHNRVSPTNKGARTCGKS